MRVPLPPHLRSTAVRTPPLTHNGPWSYLSVCLYAGPGACNVFPCSLLWEYVDDLEGALLAVRRGFPLSGVLRVCLIGRTPLPSPGSFPSPPPKKNLNNYIQVLILVGLVAYADCIGIYMHVCRHRAVCSAYIYT